MMSRLLVCFAGIAIPLAAQGESPVKTPVSLAMVGQMFMALILVLGLIVLCVWLMRRFNGLAFVNRSPIKVLSSMPVGTRERILLVAVGEQQLLVGVTPSQIQTLHVLPEPLRLDVPEPMKTPGGFQARLLDALQGKRPDTFAGSPENHV